MLRQLDVKLGGCRLGALDQKNDQPLHAHASKAVPEVGARLNRWRRGEFLSIGWGVDDNWAFTALSGTGSNGAKIAHKGQKETPVQAIEMEISRGEHWSRWIPLRADRKTSKMRQRIKMKMTFCRFFRLKKGQTK